MRVLAFGTYDARLHPRIAVLIEGLRAHGMAVDECNVPLGVGTADRVMVLQHPWRVPGLLGRIASRWVTLMRDARRFPTPDVVLVGYLGHFDVILARSLFRHSTIVLDHLISAADTAADRGRRTGGVLTLLRRLDRRAIRSADLIVLDTDEHRELMDPSRLDDVVVVPVGAPQEWFAVGTRDDGAEVPAGPHGRSEDPSVSPEPPLRVVFFGLYTPLQGTPVIGRALRLLADAPIEFTMIGYGQDLRVAVDAAGTASNVTWLRWLDSAELPRVVATHDICLGIFGDGPKSHRVVPNKVFQGLAAGCLVVTSDTLPQRRVLGDAAVFVPPNDPEALAEVLRGLAADRVRVRALRRAGRDAATSTMTPYAVTAPLARRLTETVDAVPRSGRRA